MAEDTQINFSVVDGFFLQSNSSTSAADFDYTRSNFSLIERSYETDSQCPADATLWQRFEYYVEKLNKSSPQTVRYKVLFLARHGQGDHNVGEAKYGTVAWNDYWSKLDGADGLTFFDAHLTDEGIKQAKVVNSTWKYQLTVPKTPSPQVYYTSPLYRCLQTAEVTFEDSNLPLRHPFVPQVKELLREAIGIHTCDARSSRSHLATSFPRAVFDADFAESDPLWSADYRETDAEMVPRFTTLLKEIFIADASTWVSMTAHSGAIRALLRAVGHREWELGTGEMMVVFVKGERVDGEKLAG
ncbi:MAG: hypothetical protein M1821_004755 [Bathelium mastoideum]|nr:MAG: hypothetical protein M1821_004755 [Bathelium mastoideum]